MAAQFSAPFNTIDADPNLSSAEDDRPDGLPDDDPDRLIMLPAPDPSDPNRTNGTAPADGNSEFLR